MKKFKYSLLLFRINPKRDTVSCFYMFCISFCTFKIERQTFNLNEVPLKIVVKFYKGVTNDYQKKYKL